VFVAVAGELSAYCIPPTAKPEQSAPRLVLSFVASVLSSNGYLSIAMDLGGAVPDVHDDASDNV
jgi:hypothetical protein